MGAHRAPTLREEGLSQVHQDLGPCTPGTLAAMPSLDLEHNIQVFFLICVSDFCVASVTTAPSQNPHFPDSWVPVLALVHLALQPWEVPFHL